MTKREVSKKICLLGPTGVGKTSLVKQFVESIFSEQYLTTIGVKVDKKSVALDDVTVQMMIWDIEGVDRYCGFQPRYLRGAAGYIIVVDQTRSQSLVEAREIFEAAKSACDGVAFLAINKSDLPTAWHWTEKEINTFSQQFAHSFHTSAKTGEQVENMFSQLAHRMVGSA